MRPDDVAAEIGDLSYYELDTRTYQRAWPDP